MQHQGLSLATFKDASGGAALPECEVVWLVGRQLERRKDIMEVLLSRGYGCVWDMSGAEKQGNYFEGTGVLVLDRVNGVAYVNLSERADASLAQQWADELGYKVGPQPCRAVRCARWLVSCAQVDGFCACLADCPVTPVCAAGGRDIPHQGPSRRGRLPHERDDGHRHGRGRGVRRGRGG
jgi:hypothetical protein